MFYSYLSRPSWKISSIKPLWLDSRGCLESPDQEFEHHFKAERINYMAWRGELGKLSTR